MQFPPHRINSTMGKRINRGGQKWANPLTQQKATFPLPFQPIHLDAIDTTSDTQTDYFVPFPQTLHNLAPCMQDTRPKPLPVFAQFLLVCGPCQVLCYLGRLVAHQYIMQNMQLSALCEYIVQSLCYQSIDCVLHALPVFSS